MRNIINDLINYFYLLIKKKNGQNFIFFFQQDLIFRKKIFLSFQKKLHKQQHT